VPGSDRAQKTGFVPGSRASCFLAIYRQQAVGQGQNEWARGARASVHAAMRDDQVGFSFSYLFLFSLFISFFII
jgi:hypothetical protein